MKDKVRKATTPVRTRIVWPTIQSSAPLLVVVVSLLLQQRVVVSLLSSSTATNLLSSDYGIRQPTAASFRQESEGSASKEEEQDTIGTDTVQQYHLHRTSRKVDKISSYSNGTRMLQNGNSNSNTNKNDNTTTGTSANINRQYPPGVVGNSSSGGDNEPDTSASPCPPDTVNSIYHCNDPSNVPSGVVCDKDTCLWRIRRYSKDEKPRYCQYVDISPFLTDIDVVSSSNNQIVPDDLEPCLIWELQYGFLVPTTSPAPTTLEPTYFVTTDSPSTLSPTISATFTETTDIPTETIVLDEMTTANTMFPTDAIEDDGVPDIDTPDDDAFGITVPFKKILINFFLESPEQVVVDLDTLGKVTSRHISDDIRVQLGTKSNYLYDVINVTAAEVSVFTNWASINNTIVQTYSISGAVLFDQQYQQYHEETKASSPNEETEGKPVSIRDAVRMLVYNAFLNDESRQLYIALLQISRDAGLRRIVNLYLGDPSNLTNDTTTQVGSTNGTTDDGNVESSSSLLVQWGDWDDPIMIAIVAGGGAAVIGMFAFIIMMCCCRFDKVKKEEMVAKKVSEDDVKALEEGQSKGHKSKNKAKKERSKKSITPRTDPSCGDEALLLSATQSSESVLSATNDDNGQSKNSKGMLGKAKSNRIKKSNYKKSSSFKNMFKDSMKKEKIDTSIQHSVMTDDPIAIMGDNPSPYMELYDIEETSYSKSDTTGQKNHSNNTSLEQYEASEVSSVYSYLESNTLQSMIHDEAYFIANAGYKDPVNDDDDNCYDDNRTQDGAWSLNNDGVAGGNSHSVLMLSPVHEQRNIGNGGGSTLVTSTTGDFHGNEGLRITSLVSSSSKGMDNIHNSNNLERLRRTDDRGVNVYPSPALFEVECHRPYSMSRRTDSCEIGTNDNDTITTLGNDTSLLDCAVAIVPPLNNNNNNHNNTNVVRKGSTSRYSAIVERIVDEGTGGGEGATMLLSSSSKQSHFDKGNEYFDNTRTGDSDDNDDNDDDSLKPTKMIITLKPLSSSNSDRLIVFSENGNNSDGIFDDDNLSLISGLDAPTIVADEADVVKDRHHPEVSLALKPNREAEQETQKQPQRQYFRGCDPPTDAPIYDSDASIKMNKNESVYKQDSITAETNGSNQRSIYSGGSIGGTTGSAEGKKRNRIPRVPVESSGHLIVNNYESNSNSSSHSRVGTNSIDDTSDGHCQNGHTVDEASRASAPAADDNIKSVNLEDSLASSGGMKPSPTKSENGQLQQISQDDTSPTVSTSTHASCVDESQRNGSSSELRTQSLQSNLMKYSNDIDNPHRTIRNAYYPDHTSLSEVAGSIGATLSSSNSVASASLHSTSETDSDSYPHEVVRATVAENRISASAFAFGSVRKHRNTSLARIGSGKKLSLLPVDESESNVATTNDAVITPQAPTPSVYNSRYEGSTSYQNSAGEIGNAFSSYSRQFSNDAYASESDIQSVDDDQRSLFSASPSLNLIHGMDTTPMQTPSASNNNLKDEFRFGPLPRGGAVLTDQERKHLGFGRSPNDSSGDMGYGQSDDDCDYNDAGETTSITMPSAYNNGCMSPTKQLNGNDMNSKGTITPEHSFVSMLMVDNINRNKNHGFSTDDDDLSSTAGSVDVSGTSPNHRLVSSQYPMNSMASF